RSRERRRALLASADHVEAVQLLFPGDRGLVAAPSKRVIRYVELKMFGHLVFADEAADLHADRGRRQRGVGATPYFRLQFAEPSLRGHQQALTLLLPPRGQQRVVASDQPLAREV